MNMVPLALDGAWRVLAAGLVLGAGLPVLYAFAVRGLAMAKGAGARDCRDRREFAWPRNWRWGRSLSVALETTKALP